MDTFKGVTKEVLSADILRTWVQIFSDYKKFFSEVIREDWSNKSKPLPFFITCLSFAFFIEFIIGSAAAQPTWFDVISELKEEEIEQFEEVFFTPPKISFPLEPFNYKAIVDEVLKPGSSELSEMVRQKAGGIDADSVAKHLRSNGSELLAYRIEVIAHSLEDEHAWSNLLTSLLLPLLFLAMFKLTHKLLRADDLTSKQTVNVMFYLLAISMPFSYLIDGVAWKATQNTIYSDISLGVVSILVAIFWGKVFRHTHSVSFVRMLWATGVPFSLAAILTNALVAVMLFSVLFGDV